MPGGIEISADKILQSSLDRDLCFMSVASFGVA